MSRWTGMVMPPGGGPLHGIAVRSAPLLLVEAQSSWFAERVSGIIRGALVVNPVRVDRVHVCELAWR